MMDTEGFGRLNKTKPSNPHFILETNAKRVFCISLLILPTPLFLKAYIPLGEPKEAAVNGTGYKREKQEKAVSQPEIVSEIDVCVCFFLDSNHVSTNNLQDVRLGLYGFCPAWFKEQWPQDNFL